MWQYRAIVFMETPWLASFQALFAPILAYLETVQGQAASFSNAISVGIHYQASFVYFSSPLTADMRTQFEALLAGRGELYFWYLLDLTGNLIGTNSPNLVASNQAFNFASALADAHTRRNYQYLETLAPRIGNTITIPAGTYTGRWMVQTAGTEANPVTFQADGLVVFDGDCYFNKDYITLKDIVFTYSNWSSRTTAGEGSRSTIMPEMNVNVVSKNVKLINCILHNLWSPGFFAAAENLELYGCLIFNCGWQSDDRGHGHGIYTQNQIGIKRIANCIIHNNFALNLKVYAESGSLVGYVIEDNTIFNAGILDELHGPNQHYWNILVGSINNNIKADNITIRRNATYHVNPTEQSNHFGYNGGIQNALVENNYFAAPVALAMINEGTNVVVQNNTIAGNVAGFLASKYPNNSYSSFANLGNVSILSANEYDSERANLTIYNQANADTVSVDVSAIYANGDMVNVHNAQDYFVDIQELTVTGGLITVDMQAINRSVQAPIQWTAPATTFPTFGAFVLRKQ